MRFNRRHSRSRLSVVRFEQLEQRTVLAAGQLDATFGSGGTVRTEFDSTNTSGDTALDVAIDSASRLVAVGKGGMARFMPDGSLDSSFGQAGRAATPFYTRAVALQSDGKIVIAGGTSEFNSTDLMLARFLANGALDTSFSSDGIAQIDVGGISEWATTLLVEPSGRIVVAGGAREGMAVARVLATGELDTSFSTDGWFTRQVNRNDKAYGLTRQTNGQILVVGTSLITQDFFGTNYDMSVTRVNTNGTVDAAFGFSGTTYANFLSGRYSNDQGRGIAVQADGKIVISGSAYGNFDEYTGVARFLSNGALDVDFGTEGRVRVPVSIDYASSDIVPLASGRLLVSNYQGVFALDSQGVVDTSFGVNGRAVSSGTVQAMVVQSDGAIVLVGYFLYGFGVRRFLADGSADTSFSRDGIAVAAMGPSNDTAMHSALQPDGKIIVVGGGQRGYNVARYLPDGQLDTSFSEDGLTNISLGDEFYDAMATAVALQSDGRIVIAGWIRESNSANTSSRMGVIRLNIDGTLDSGFSSDGIQLSELTGYAEAHSVLVQPDGKIVIAGHANGYATLLRLNGDGTYDTRFSGDGVVAMATSDSYISSIVLQPDGRILAAGFQRPSNNNGSFGSILMMARFNSNGSLDSTFGVKGKMIDPANLQRTADDVVLLPDGRFVVVGEYSFYRQNSESSQLAVSRYNADGSVDGTFGTRIIDHVEPFVLSSFQTYGARTWGTALLRQADGKVVVVGHSDQRMIAARLNDDGSQDSSFGGDGIVDISVTGQTVRATNVILGLDGQLVVSGYVGNNSPSVLQRDFYLARLTNENVPAYSTSVRINALGNVEIYDAWGRDDRWQFERTADAIVVRDVSADVRSSFRVINLPEVTGDGLREISIPLSRIQATGKPLLINSMDGDDQLSFDPAFDAPSTGFVFRAGNGSDRMIIEQSTVPVAWVMSTAHSGSARPQGKVPLNFNGVERLTGGTQNDSFRLVYQASPLVLSIEGGPGGYDSAELRADANMSFTYESLPVWGQRLIVENSLGRQETAMRNIASMRLSGGASNNTIDAREYNGIANLYGSGGDDVLIASRGPSNLFGDDGNDHLFGGQWNDTLRGGRGDDMLLGYYGDDMLYGDDGLDVLSGDYGTDRLYGGNGDDLVIGGVATRLGFFEPAAARDAILATWRSSDSYLTKIQKLSVDGVGVDNSIKLNFGSGVFDDFVVDTVYGNSGTDWFLVNPLSEIGLTTGGLRDQAVDEQYLV